MFWSEDCENCFNDFKKLLTEAPILSFPNFDMPFRLYTDACDRGLGIVLAQDSMEGEKTIAYASRALKTNEKNYAVIEKEALAIRNNFV